jgi:hypothetical protein
MKTVIWVSPVKTDSELRYTELKVAFKLVGQAVAQGGVPPVEVEVGVEVVGDLQTGLVEASKAAAAEQQFGFERAPTRLGLGLIIGVTRPDIAGQGLLFFNARPAHRAGVLTAAVGVDNQAGSWLA